jgi:quercetin dioxygenase-like cupin family protein
MRETAMKEMKTVNRRDVCAMVASLTALAAAGAVGAEGQAAGDAMAVPPPPGSAGDKVLATPRAFRFEDLPVVKNVNGETRQVAHGVLPTGELVDLHETTLLPGHMPHPPHKHRHSEFMMVREGEMEFENDGTPERMGPGGVMFAASNVMHGLKNVGTTTANYFVLAIGRDGAVERV